MVPFEALPLKRSRTTVLSYECKHPLSFGYLMHFPVRLFKDADPGRFDNVDSWNSTDGSTGYSRDVLENLLQFLLIQPLDAHAIPDFGVAQ
jgi:hypothetical protein